MLSDLTARSDVRGGRVDVSWTWSGLGDRPAFRLVRRRTAYPSGAEDGYPVLDTSALFRAPDEPWPHVEQLRFVAAGSSAEGGLLQAAVTLFGEAAAEVSLHGLAPLHLEGLTAVERSEPAPGVEQITLVPGGTLTISSGQLEWAPDAGDPASIDFDVVAALSTDARVLAATEQELAVQWTREDAELVLRERFSEDSGDWTRAFEVRDLGAAAEEPAYYRVFRDAGGWVTEREWIARATATAPYGFPDRLYGLLPALHRNHDEPDPADRGNGQLRRFMAPFGVALDHLRSEAESLRDRHDPVRAREDLLPPLGGWIGWPVDRTAPLPVQRSEIRMAPDVYDTVGTVPNIVALATRVTGWPCAAKEFVHNVFMTNAPEAVPVRELREMAHDGTAWGAPVLHATTDAFDGRPAAVVDPDGATRLFWHSNRSGRWEIWSRTLGGATDPTPLFPSDPDASPPASSDVSPAPIVFEDALWLFWESDRHGVLDVWAQVDGGTPFALTSHAAADRRPSPAVGPDGALWVFWESERRGPPEIWSRRYDGTAWSAAVRVTEGLGRDHEPAAAVDPAGALRLVWRRDESDRSRLYERALTGGTWGPIEPLEDGPWRDESPTLALLGGDLWLLWHSDRTGRWELWARTRAAGGWEPPQQLTQRPDPDKEPALIADGAALGVFWRAERIAPEYRSRTVDVTDVAALEQLGRLPDRLHYTYDAARGELDWYARDVAGLYLTPPPGTPEPVVEDVLERARTYLEPFCPATVRLVLIPVRAAEAADLHTDDFDQGLVDLFQDETE